MPKKGDFGFDKMQKGFERFKRTMPKLVAEQSKNHFVEGFRRGGGQTDASRSGWKPRKTPRTPREQKRSTGRAILVKTGAMRGDILARTVTPQRVVVNVIHVKYAGYHNNGTAKLPQREFIGKSTVLEQKNRRLIESELNKIKP